LFYIVDLEAQRLYNTDKKGMRTLPDFRMLDMDSYPRREHFEYFRGMRYPYVGTTVEVDITQFATAVHDGRLPFFLSFLYLVSTAANAVPEFRQRILDGGIAEYDSCPTSHTLSLPDGTYCYCTLESGMAFDKFIPYAMERQDVSRSARSLDDGEDGLPLIFVSTVPWISYTALTQPVPEPADSNPRITWGKYFTRDDRIFMPVTVLCNHALVDGLQIAKFYSLLERQIAGFGNK
jgi:chloramphenicol O-acetyltransferase type A